MDDLRAAVDRIATETGFSGVVRVDRGGTTEIEAAYGLARRDLGVRNHVDTQIGIASGGKGLTALAVVSLIVDGRLRLDTTARSLLGDDLPLVDDAVTVEHLLAHRSGIGDYLDEEGEIDAYVMTRPVHELATTEAFLPMLDGHPQVFPPGERFSYNNGGFVVLALLAERASGTPFHDLVAERVCRPAGMADTVYLRADELPGRVAAGYLDADGLRTNVLHLPVRGTGDGGAYATAADIHALWAAFFAGGIVPAEWVTEMTRSRSDPPEHSLRYGLGFWLHQTGPAVLLEGYDAGASFRTAHDPTTGFTYTVLANTSEGAWPLVRFLDELLTP